MDVSARSQLLLEPALSHGSHEASAPLHGWWDWYARVHGRSMSSPAEAAAPADRSMADVEHAAASRA